MDRIADPGIVDVDADIDADVDVDANADRTDKA